MNSPVFSGKTLARLKQIVLLSACMCCFSACGQKGPLYLPGDNHPAKKTHEARPEAGAGATQAQTDG